MILLSSKEYGDIKNNSLHVTDIDYTDKKKISYNTIAYIGKRLRIRCKEMNLNNVVSNVHTVDVCKTKNTFFCITTTVQDVLAACPNTIILPSSSRYKDNSHEVASFDTKGMVLLYYAIISKKPKTYDMKFDYDFAKQIKRVKNSTIKKGDHNGSTGLYYSFGNKGSYEMVNNSSVGQYTTKVVKNKETNAERQKWCCSAENLIGEHLNESIQTLKSYIRNIPKLISPVIDVAYGMQKEHGDVNLKATKERESGIWMSTIVLNGQTSNFHSENDCTYTLVTVPKQCNKMNHGNKNRRMFLININEQNIFAVPMTHNLSLLYSGNFITHRQHCDRECEKDGSLFYNIVSYGNQRLYSHLKKSFLRNNT